MSNRVLRSEIYKQFRSDRKMRSILLRIAGIVDEAVETTEDVWKKLGYVNGQGVYVEAANVEVHYQAGFDTSSSETDIQLTGTGTGAVEIVGTPTFFDKEFVVAITTASDAETACKFAYGFADDDLIATNVTAAAVVPLPDLGIELQFEDGGIGAGAFVQDDIHSLDLTVDTLGYIMPGNRPLGNDGVWLPESAEGDGYEPDKTTITLSAQNKLQVAKPYPGVDNTTIKVEGGVLEAQLPTVPEVDGATVKLSDGDGKIEVINPYPAELAYLTTDGPVAVASASSTDLPLTEGDAVGVDINSGEPKIEVEGFYAVYFSTAFGAVTGDVECVLMGSTFGIIDDDNADNLTGMAPTIRGCCNVWLPAGEILTLSVEHTDAGSVDVIGKIWIKRVG